VESLIRDPKIRETLIRIVAYEEAQEEKWSNDPILKNNPYRCSWELMDIPADWQIVRKLLMAGMVKKVGRRDYLLVDREAVKNVLTEYESLISPATVETVTAKTTEMPEDLFEIIEGYEDLKLFLKMSLKAEEPVHALLVGPPGTAKSMFLMELERLEGSYFVTAGTMTKVGLRDIIFDGLPKILLIDELDKLADPKDVSALLTWMESGRIIIAKHGLHEERRGRGWVYAACNATKGLPPELLDRFQVFHIKPYTPEQYVRVVTGYLTKRMGVEAGLARYIAQQTQRFTVSVRQAVRIAKLAKTREDVDTITRIIASYGGTP